MPITYTRGDVISQTTFTSTQDPRGQIVELIEQAKLADDKLHQFMGMLSAEVNNESGRPITYTRAPIKTRQRIAEKCGIKVWEDPSKDIPAEKTPLLVKDISRATIVFTTIAQMLAFRDYIYHTDEFIAIKDKLSPAVKDLWTADIENGTEYKDIKFFLQVMINYRGTRIPHIVELQLNAVQMDRGKHFGHAFYNVSRLAMIDGKQVFSPADPECTITIPGKIKGKVADKLRMATVHCRSIAQGDPEIMLATNIISKMLQDKSKFKMACDMKKSADASGAAESGSQPTAADGRSANDADPYAFMNGTKPVVILCGPYNAKKAGHQDTGPAQAWAISRLACFIWGHFTECQNAPGITGTAANWHGH